MINKDTIVFNEPVYYIPNYSKSSNRVKIIKLINDNVALVEMVFNKKQKKEMQPFSTPLQHIYNQPEHARLGQREWENYMKKRKKRIKQNKHKKA